MGKKNRRRNLRVIDNPRRNGPAPLSPRNQKQSELLHELEHRDLIFALGAAGTGKTYLATRFACELFEDRTIDKIIVTRPMVSAEDDVGYLPGELVDKFAPYFAPVREIMIEHLGRGPFEYALKNEQIELAPVGFLRGHTFRNCFVILDEAQNLTKAQMKLFLTRIGEDAKVCISGDIDQCDLEDPRDSGLADASRRFGSLPEVGAVQFTMEDCVRSGLVRKILQGYTK